MTYIYETAYYYEIASEFNRETGLLEGHYVQKV